MSRQFTVTVYLLSELAGRAREAALDFMRAGAVGVEVHDTEEAAAALVEAIAAQPDSIQLNASNIRAFAHKVGSYHAATLADDAIEILCREKRARFLDRINATPVEVMDAVQRAESARIRRVENCPQAVFPDERLIREGFHAGYYFDDEGRFITVEA